MISSQQLGERITDARKRAKLTQAQLAERVGLSRQTVVAMEKGERRPGSVELVKVAEAVGATVHELLRETAVRAEVSPRFRIGMLDRQAPEVAQAVERLRQFGAWYVELERLHGLHRVHAPLENLQTYRAEPGSAPQLDPTLEGEAAARSVRAVFGLGDEPAMHLDERFEAEAGLRIFYLDHLPAKVAAFLIWTDGLGACVAINRSHPPARQRWSLAHEVGHFLRDREAGDVLEMDESLRQPGEVFPEAFAKEFLLPTAGVQKRFTERCRGGKFTPVDLYSLATTFGVSFQAMSLRLEELKLLPRGSYEKILRNRLSPKTMGSEAPLPPRRQLYLGLPERYVALAVSAYDQELLSESEFAEMLSTDIASARIVYQDKRQIEVDDGLFDVDLTGTDLRKA